MHRLWYRPDQYVRYENVAVEWQGGHLLAFMTSGHAPLRLPEYHISALPRTVLEIRPILYA